MYQHKVEHFLHLLIWVNVDHFCQFPFIAISIHFQQCNISSIQKFLIETNHFCLSCKVARNSLCHLFQNSLHICCTLLQRLLQYKSGFPNAPGGGITTFDFIVRRWLGESATSLLTSLMVSTTSGLELTMASTSVNRVFNDSSSKLLLWVLNNDAKIFLADQICLSHIPPMTCHGWVSLPNDPICLLIEHEMFDFL